MPCFVFWFLFENNYFTEKYRLKHVDSVVCNSKMTERKSVFHEKIVILLIIYFMFIRIVCSVQSVSCYVLLAS